MNAENPQPNSPALPQSSCSALLARWSVPVLDTGLTVRVMKDGVVKLYSTMPRRRWAGGFNGPTHFWITPEELEAAMEIVRVKRANAPGERPPAANKKPL